MDFSGLNRYSGIFKIRSPRSIYFYSILIGCLAGIFAVGFSWALAWSEHLVFHEIIGLQRSHPVGEIAIHAATATVKNNWLILFFPMAGGLVIGLILKYLHADASGSGTDAMVHAFHHKEGFIRARGALYKSLATIFTLATGGSAGREGPTAYIGAGIGSRIARFTGAGPRAKRTLLLAGVAGALGAIFRAPFGGAVTAVEIIYLEDFESDSLVPCIMSSVSGYLVFSVLAGPGTLFNIPPIANGNYRDLLIYGILGFICYAFGFIYVKFFHLVTDLFNKLKVSIIWKPALGGVVVGITGYFFPDVLGSGMGLLQTIFHGKLESITQFHSSILAVGFFGLALLKVCTTSFTIGSGGSGGLFAPSLFIGAMLGGAVCQTANLLLPGWKLPLIPFMLVGMGAFFAGVARAPVASMIMVGDIIGSYKLLPPLMIVTMITLVMSNKWSLYKTQLKNKFQSPAHFWDMELNVLDKLYIGDQFQELRKNAIITMNTLLADLEDLSLKIQASDFIVTKETGVYVGIVSLKKSHLVKELQNMRNLITVDDVTDTSIPAIFPEESLAHALRIIMEKDVDKVAIVNRETMMVDGYIRYHDIFSVYHKHIKVANKK